jgi:hypothetical protein
MKSVILRIFDFLFGALFGASSVNLYIESMDKESLIVFGVIIGVGILYVVWREFVLEKIW